MIKQLVLLYFIFFSSQAMADYEFFRGVRQMGMGGASIAVVNDETAVLSNPNGLGRLRDNFYTLIDPEITASAGRLDTLAETMAYYSMIPEDLYNALADDVNEPYYFKSQIFPSIVFPNFGVGILGRYEIMAQRLGDGTFNYKYVNDYSLNLAYNMRFWGGRIKLGMAGRLINRVEFDGNLDPAVDSLSIRSFGNEGMGLGVDVGLTLAAPWKWLPTISAVVRDVGGTTFTFSDGAFNNGGTGTPQSVNQSIDVAVALFPIYSKYSRGAITVEYTGVDNMEGVTDQMDRLHMGMEVNLFDAYFIRGGYHEGDWTAGLEYASGIFQFQMATYAEEMTIGSTTKNDRRGVFKLAIRF